MNRTRIHPWLALLLIASATSCGTLDPAGPYRGNKVLYDADIILATSYDTLHAFVTWEFQNRQVLASMPQIKLFADRIRLNAPRWFASAVALRDQYRMSSTAPNATALQTALDVLRQAVSEATTYLATEAPIK